MTNPALGLDASAMRALGHRVVDMIVEHYEHGDERAVTAQRDEVLEALRSEPLPEHGRRADEVLERVAAEVLGNLMHVDHRRFFAFVPSASNYVGVLADALASGFNVFAGTWLEAKGAAAVELATIEWIRGRCGFGPGAGGLFVSGGSAANLTALFVARHLRLGTRFGDAVVYGSDQVHSAVDRTLRVLGFRSDQFRRLPSDDGFRLDPQRVATSIREDRAAGRVPFAVIANAGTTNTGAVDPLPELAVLCRDEGLWLHADGAYGGAAVFSDRGRALLPGIDQVDSLALDPHKWLFQPFEIGCVLVRDVRWLDEAFDVRPEYLKDVETNADEVNFCDRGFQLTRGFRALKLWMSLQVHGRRAFEEAIDGGLARARLAETLVAARPDWEVATPVSLSVLAFRCVPADLDDEARDELNRSLVQRAVHDGFCMVSSTTLRGRVWLRMCPINPRTTDADVAAVLDRLDELRR